MAGRFPSNEPKKTKDTATGRVYDSRNKAGRAVAQAEFPDLDAQGQFVWYQVLQLCRPGRFVDVAEGLPSRHQRQAHDVTSQTTGEVGNTRRMDPTLGLILLPLLGLTGVWVSAICRLPCSTEK